MVSDITAECINDSENISPNSNVDKTAVVNERVDSWTRSLLDLPAFEYAFIHEHLVGNSETMPVIVHLVHIAIKIWDIAFLKKIMKKSSCKTQRACKVETVPCEKSCVCIYETPILYRLCTSLPNKW